MGPVPPLGPLLLALLSGSAFAGEPGRPNIVLIVADDFGRECLGTGGGTSYRTPHLDALAAGGVRFENCFSTPLCTPSRVQFMTGRYGFRTGQRWGQIDPREKTFAQLLKATGYATAVAGKWQLADFSRDPDHPRRQGFDEHCLWTWEWKGRRTSRYWNPSIWKDGKLLEGVEEEYGPDVYCDFLIDFMRRNRSGPFLAYYPMTLVHAPFERPPGRGSAGRRKAARPENFADMVRYLDGQVGRIVAALDELSLREETLVLFTADNGTLRSIVSEFRGRRVRGGKGTLADAGIRVPLIASWKGKAAPGSVSEDLVDLSDVFSTVLEAAGVEEPRGTAIDGRSFLPGVLGRQGTAREWVYVQLWEERCVRDRRWKLHGDGRLFDLERDPLEKKALAAVDAAGEAAAARVRLEMVLDRLRGDRVGKPWSRHAIDDASQGADGVRLGDADGDGLLDIVTGWEEGGLVRLAINPGPGKVRERWPSVTVGRAESVEDAVLVDLDRDGRPEVVSSSEGRKRALQVHWPPADRSRLLDPAAWKTEEVPASRDLMAWLYSTPLELDGKGGIDLVSGGKSAGAAIGWLESPGDPRDLGAWKWHHLREAGWVMSLIPRDMDGDGDLDVLSSDRRGAGRGAFWLENPGREAARSPWKEHRVGGEGREVMFLAAADLDADGLGDVLAAVREKEILWLRRQSADGKSWRAHPIDLPSSAGTAKGVAAGDLDLDGDLDLAYTCEAAGRGKPGVGWLSFRESPAERQWESHDISGPQGVKFDLIELLDLDQDGDLDALTTEETAGLGVIWYENPIR